MLHGGDVLDTARRLGRDYRELLDFSANLNPEGCPEEVLAAAREGIARAGVYPDASQRELREAIGRREGVPADCLIAGNGASELVFAVCWGLRPRRALLAEPSFLEYGRALASCEAQILRWPMRAREGNPADLCLDEGYLEALDGLGRGDMAILCTPNNPTGRRVPEEILEEAASLCRRKGIYLLLDECFLNFVPGGRSRMREAGEDGSLLVLKSFTKMYGMPGLRLGYVAAGDPKVRRAVRSCMQDWSVSCAAEAAGLAICRMGGRGEDFERRAAQETAVRREALREGLRRAGAWVSGGEANYLLFCMPGRPRLREELLEEGILIRSCANYPGLGDTFYRTAVRGREDNERLLRAVSRRARAEGEGAEIWLSQS